MIVALASVEDLNEETLERLAALFPNTKLLVFRPDGPLGVELTAEAEQAVFAKEDFKRRGIEQRLRSVARESRCAAYVVPVRNYLGAGYRELIEAGRTLAEDKTWVLPPDGVLRPVGPWLRSLAELSRPARKLRTAPPPNLGSVLSEAPMFWCSAGVRLLCHRQPKVTHPG